MKKPVLFLGILAIALVIVGIVVYKAVVSPKQQTTIEEDPTELLQLAPADQSVVVEATKSKTKDNTVVLSIAGLGGKYTSVAYEISYDSQGVTQGVTSKPLDVTGKDTFVRDDIYLGTCSRNVCRPHLGVASVSVILLLTDTSGQKSQFSKEYEL